MNKFVPHGSSEQQKIISAYLSGDVGLQSAIRMLEKCSWEITQSTMLKLLACSDAKSRFMLEALEDFESKATVKGNPKKLLKEIVENDLRVADAAEKLFITLSSANKYMKILRNYFKCKTTAALVHRAIKEGFLSE